ncbi:hypothetical protein [Paraburkholderia caffeinilytica]|uniref:hypothetical protein n=1 Tax=Paraburkholderia caffeinilytica TaxID=1761016 RepID=UPI0038BAAC66
MNTPVIQARRAAITISGARNAHVEVNKAVARGDLPVVSTQNCVDCGVQAQAYDHRDYANPLDVQPVCDSCNALRGRALPNPETLEKYREAVIESERGWKARAEQPALAPIDSVAECESFRDAVRLGWELRRIQNMTRSSLAERIGAYASHVSDYMHPDDQKARRNLPADLIDDFEWAAGNRAVTQYLLYKAGIELTLTIMEEVIAQRAA